MATMNEWIESSEERRKLVAQERFIALVADEIYAVMQEEGGTSKSALAQSLGRSKAFVTQILSGSRNLTLRTLADIATVLGRAPLFQMPKPQAQGNWESLPGASSIRLRPRAALTFVCMNDDDAVAEEAA